MKSLGDIRVEIDKVNDNILELLNLRAKLTEEVADIKEKEGTPVYIPEREMEMLKKLIAKNRGPFPDEAIKRLFKEIFRASVSLMQARKQKARLISRHVNPEDHVITIGDITIGSEPVMMAGPCAIEDEKQMDMVGYGLKKLGVPIIRGGAFKPRSSPYSFQGLGEIGLKLLRETADKYGFKTVTEVMDTRSVELVSQYADILQIGSRNMYNYDLLREVGRSNKPIFLKRGLSATVDELLFAAEYIVAEGNKDVILCERGIRTFETQTRNTLDISAVPILRQACNLPVIVDVSHAAGRKDILAPLAKAALASGANGLMIEVHPFPAIARSDSRQQLDLEEFGALLKEINYNGVNTPDLRIEGGISDSYAINS